MRLANDSPAALAEPLRPQGLVLKGQYTGAWRSEKGKLKGLLLNTGDREYVIKLPKYLRPMLVRELMPNALIQVWVYPDGQIWRGINILPLSEPECLALQSVLASTPAPVSPPAPSVSIQVCSKGKCCKQGSQRIWQRLQAEVAANPQLQHVSVELTGCLKACKQGPNLRVLPGGQVLNQASTATALAVLSESCLEG